MYPLLERIDRVAEEILDTLKRFPLVSFSAYLFALIMIAFMSVGQIEMETYPNYHFFNKLAFTLTLMIPLLLLLRLIFPFLISTLIGLGVLTYYFTTLPPILKSSHAFEEYGQLHLFLIGATLLLLFPAPYLFKKVSNERCWQWTKELFFALLWALLFSIILYLGLYGVSYTLKTLFSVPFSSDLVPQIILIIFGLFSINYFLSQIPKEPLKLTIKPYNNTESILSKYILTPLIIVYFVILFLYTIKIIFLGEAPKNSISILSLLFSSLGILTFLFLTGVWNRKKKEYKKIIWIAILIQTLILAVSIYFRIEQYGFTQNRYFVLLLGIWLLLLSLYFLLAKNASYKWIFTSLALLAILLQFEPFSGKNLVKESQITQLKKILGEEDKLSETTDLQIRYNISSKIDYLYNQYGEDALLPVLPQIVSEFKLIKNSRKIENCNNEPTLYFVSYATQKLGFTAVSQWEWKRLQEQEIEKNRPIYISSNTFYNREVLNITGYDWLQRFSFQITREGELFCPPQDFSIEENQNSTPFQVKTKKNHIFIYTEGKELAQVEIQFFLQKVRKIWEDQNKKSSPTPYKRFENIDNKKLIHHYENKNIKIKFLFESIEFSTQHQLNHYAGKILIHPK